MVLHLKKRCLVLPTLFFSPPSQYPEALDRGDETFPGRFGKRGPNKEKKPGCLKHTFHNNHRFQEGPKFKIKKRQCLKLREINSADIS